MTIILTFTAASFVSSILVIAACALSSQVSQEDGVQEIYTDIAESGSIIVKSATPFSLN